MGNLIVIFIILLIIGSALLKIIIDKRNGVKCSGCPHAPKGGNRSKNAHTNGCNSQNIVTIKTKP